MTLPFLLLPLCPVCCLYCRPPFFSPTCCANMEAHPDARRYDNKRKRNKQKSHRESEETREMVKREEREREGESEIQREAREMEGEREMARQRGCASVNLR